MKTFWGIFVFDLKRILKNPILWIGTFITLTGILIYHNFYFTQYPFVTEDVYHEEFIKHEKHEPSHALDLIIFASEQEVYQTTVVNYCIFLETNYGINGYDTADYIISNNLDYNAINAYVKPMISGTQKPVILLNSDTIGQFRRTARKGEYNEYIALINDKLSKEKYTDYLGRFFTEFFGTAFLYCCFVVSVMIFDADVKKNLFDLLHSKKIRPSIFISSKFIGSGIAIILAGAVAMTVINVLICIHCYNTDMAFNFFTIYKYYFAWVAPSILFVLAFSAVITFVFRTGLPAIPILFFQHTLGSKSTLSDDGFHTVFAQEFWNITVRLSNNSEYPLQELPQSFYNDVVVHKLFQLGIIVLCLLISIFFYNKRYRINKDG